MRRIGWNGKLTKAILFAAFVLSIAIQSNLMTMYKTSQASSATTIYVDPPTITTVPFSNFTVNINVKDAANLHAWSAWLQWDPQILDFVNATEGDFFLSSIGMTKFGNKSEAWIFVGSSLWLPDPGVNGNGTLANVTFRGVGSGESKLDLYNTKLFSEPQQVTPPPYFGDANDDKWVDAIDLSMVGFSFGTFDGDPNYNPSADFDYDGSVDYFDLLCVSHNWGTDYNHQSYTTRPQTSYHDFSDGSVTIDGTAPETTDDYDGSWFNTDFTINLTADDALSGVAETYYKINDGSTKIVSIDDQPNITTESANNTLEYWSVDTAGSVEPHNFLIDIKLDKTVPSGSVIINDGDDYTTSTSVTLSLTATDATSGVYQVRFSNDGVWNTEPWENFSASKPWTLTAGDGTKKVHVQFKNNAGLVSITYSDTIVLSTGKETSSISISMSATTCTLGESTTVSGFLSPPREGVSITIQFRPSGGTWTKLEEVTTSSDGGYWFTWTPTSVGTYEVRANWEGDETTLWSESIGQPITVKASSPAEFPLWILAPVIGGITGVTAVSVYLRRRKHKEKVLKPAEPIITGEPTEISAPAKKTEEVLKTPEGAPPQKVKEVPKLSAKCSDTITLLHRFIEDPSLTNDRKAWKGFREFIAIAEEIEDEYAELIEIRNKLAVLRRKRNEYRSAGLDDLADKTEGLIQRNYGESIRIMKQIQEKLPQLGG